MGAKKNDKTNWQGVVDRCTIKLTSWKTQYLSLRGRLSLALDGMPTYLMSMFQLPVYVEKKLNTLKE